MDKYILDESNGLWYELDYSGDLGATCPDFESHHSEE